MNRPSPPNLASFDRHAGWLAAACCALAVLGFAAALPEFSHACLLYTSDAADD